MVTVVVQQSIGHLKMAVFWSPNFCEKNFTSDMERRGDLGSPGGRGWIGRTSPECWRVEGREREMLMGRGEGMDG